MEFEVGKKIKATWERENNRYTAQGTLVKIVEPLVGLTEQEVLKYAKLPPLSRMFKNVQGKTCKVHRLVLTRGRSHYSIVPVNGNMNWKFEILKPAIEKLPPLICTKCGGTNITKDKETKTCNDCSTVFCGDKETPKDKEYLGRGKDPKFDTGDYIEGTEGVHAYSSSFMMGRKQ